MNESIINQLKAALDETVQLLSSFEPDEINKVPFEGSWTAAQAAQHLFLSQKDMDKLLLTQTLEVNRPADANAENLKSIFLNFDQKFKSPDFIDPEDKIYDKSELIKSLQDVESKLVKAAQDANLTQEAPLPPGHPLQGNSKLEIIYFTTYHAMRHNRQITNIKNTLNSRS